MIRGGILNSRARPVRRSVPAVARALAGTAVAAVGGLAVSLATGVVPALAAQHPGGPAASQTRADARGQHSTAGRMSPGTPWARIAAGGDHTCGIRTDGTLWCWGDNASGELGLGNHTGQDRPRQVTTPAAGGWASITAGTFYTCATRTGGTLWCWGDNDSGALGLGPGGGAGQDLPRQVTTPARGGWAYVTAGGEDTCGIRTDATLWCWGENDNGQLGTDSPGAPDLPQQVTTPARGGWARVTAASDDTCATRTGATLWCWGQNGERQLGIGNYSDQALPRQVITPAADGWASVTVGGDYACGIRADATLWCWGYNGDGELGLGNHTPHDRPRPVTTPVAGGWASVTADGASTCGIRTGGTLWCWGDNSDGQLGIGNHTAHDRPRQVTGCMQPAAQTPARRDLHRH